MKTEHFPLVIAIIAAAASIAGIAFSQYGAVALDRQKWEQSQSDLKQKSLEEAVFNYARDLGGALQQVELLSWTAINDPESVTATAMNGYDKSSGEILNKIAGHRLILVAQNPTAAAATDKAANAFYVADECVSKAGVQLRADRASGLAALGRCKKLGENASAILFNEFKAILTNQPAKVQ